MIWGAEWDDLLEKDTEGLLVKRMGEVVDGEYQKYAVESGAYVRKQFWGADPRLLEMVKHLSDEQLKRLTLGGHDPAKVYNAYKRAHETKGMPTVILARTIKGYGVGESGEGKNVTHQQKKLNDDEVKAFRTRFGIPISDEEVAKAPFYRPPQESVELKYMLERRKTLGGPVPTRKVRSEPIRPNLSELFGEFHKGTEARKASTTMVFVRMLSKLLRDEQIGKLVVPIVPDEARTFGMEALFRQVGIYAHGGQLYEPVDMDTLLYYKEAQDGQILEEGINEAGSMSSFIAAGHRVCDARHQHDSVLHLLLDVRVPAHRRSDLGRLPTCACADSCSAAPPAGRRSMAKACSIRMATATCMRCPYPTCQAYDPAFAYELAVIIEDGIKRMYGDQENIFYYLTLMNEQYEHPRDARRRARRHPQRDVRHQADDPARQQAARADLRQRNDRRRGAQGAEPSSRRNTASAPTSGA